jgi:hypothetical protein
LAAGTPKIKVWDGANGSIAKRRVSFQSAEQPLLGQFSVSGNTGQAWESYMRLQVALGKGNGFSAHDKEAK